MDSWKVRNVQLETCSFGQLKNPVESIVNGYL